MTAPTGTRYRYFTATSLDGFIADEHDNLDWLLSQPSGETSILTYDDFIAEIGAVVMGSTTYEWVLDHASEVDHPNGIPWAYEQPTFVFTHRDLVPTAEHISMLSGPPWQHRETLEDAAAGKDIWVVGGGGLAADFARVGMLDEIYVSIAPVMLGAGRELFAGNYDLELRDLGRSGAFLEACYDVVGPRG